MLTVKDFLMQIQSEQSQEQQSTNKDQSNNPPQKNNNQNNNNNNNQHNKAPTITNKNKKKKNKKKNDKKKNQANNQEVEQDHNNQNNTVASSNNSKPSQWENKMMVWFSHLRNNLGSLSIPRRSTNFESIQRFIESGEFPKLSQIGDEDQMILQILSYFSEKGIYMKNDLFWLFSYLTTIDRLCQPEIYQFLQKIVENINNQILNLSKTDSYNELLPYLNIISTLIQKFFHQFH